MRASRPASVVCTALLCALAAIVGIAAVAQLRHPGGFRTGAAHDTDMTAVAEALDTLTVQARRVHVLGYSRDHFGGWTDQWHGTGTDGAVCTTRDIMMLDVFTASPPAATAPDRCPSPTGTAVDVYTGDPLSPDEVEIDHVVPLAAAWDHGAHSWTPDTRAGFANNRELNLLAVDGTVNRSKSDGTLGEWLPPAADGPGSPSTAGCAYAARYLAVCAHYGLTISAADAGVGRRTCGL
ncbi:MAG: HNH endonuclease family protein [Mycobacteriaceae bacterium]|uniref:HNH endonuclease family protein n=1 Tax=Corynebacterium sp. TaxID=1720 RepID=UPI003F9E4FA3